GGGQFCTKPGVILLVGDREHRFAEALAREIEAGTQTTMLSRSLRDSFSERAGTMSSIKGVKRAVSGTPSQYARHMPVLLETTAEVFLREPRLRDEAFGPGGIVVECEDVGEAIACVESLGGNLTGTVHVGDDEDRAATTSVLRVLEGTVGRMIV